MSATEQYPNLSSPIWDRIRVPPRRDVVQIATLMCVEAGFDPDMVRNIYISRKITPPGLIHLRCRIMVALRDAGFTASQAQGQWFIGFKLTTLLDYLYDGKKMEAQDA